MELYQQHSAAIGIAAKGNIEMNLQVVAPGVPISARVATRMKTDA
jgi:hypothetical protein